MSSESKNVVQAIIDALSKHVCVLDEKGTILFINKAWCIFANENGIKNTDIVGAGVNYLSVCDKASANGDPIAGQVAAAIRSVINNQSDNISLEYPCHSPVKERWFYLRINRLSNDPLRIFISHENITERRVAEVALGKSQSRLNYLISETPLVIYAAAATPPYAATFVSDNILQQFGYHPEDFLSKPDFWSELIHPEDKVRIMGASASAIEFTDTEYRFRHKDGHYIWVRDQFRLVKGMDNLPVEYIGYLINIDAKKHAELKLYQMAHYDELTRLPNRTLFYDRLIQALAVAKRNSWYVGILFVDLDRFKVVNDTLGHGIGDELLRQVSERLTATIRGDDTVGRLGGDEFAVILAKLTRPKDAALVCRKILRVFQQPFDIQSREIFITPSIGITIYPEDSQLPDELIKNADTAMYHAKGHGKNRFKYYTAEMNNNALERLDMETALRHALNRNEFVLYYQPKIDIKTSRIIGFEALIRWNNSGKLIPPGDFIPLLEETGLIIHIGSWALSAACKQIKKWKRQGFEPLPVSVNLSPRQFQQESLLQNVLAIIKENKISPSLIELEITESSLMQDPESAIRILKILQDNGISISIDDFGTGYSSLSYLKRFPVNSLKIDKSFVADVMHDSDATAIVMAIITMGRQLGIDIIAEGVETEVQRDFLYENGCYKAQGYLFGKPMPVSEIEGLLNITNRASVN